MELTKLTKTLQEMGLAQSDIDDILNKRSQRQLEGIPYLAEFAHSVGEETPFVTVVRFGTPTAEEMEHHLWLEYKHGQFVLRTSPWKIGFTYHEGGIYVFLPKAMCRAEEVCSNKSYPISVLTDIMKLYNEEQILVHSEKMVEIGFDSGCLRFKLRQLEGEVYSEKDRLLEVGFNRLEDMLTKRTMFLNGHVWSPIEDAWETGIYLIKYPDRGFNFFPVKEEDLERLEDATELILTPEVVTAMREVVTA